MFFASNTSKCTCTDTSVCTFRNALNKEIVATIAEKMAVSPCLAMVRDAAGILKVLTRMEFRAVPEGLPRER